MRAVSRQKLIYFFILVLLPCMISAQYSDIRRVTSRASITATIVSVVDHKRDYVCFGTQIYIQIPGYLAGFLKGNPKPGNDVVIRSTSNSMVFSQEELTGEDSQKSLTNLIHLSDRVLQSSVQHWLEQPYDPGSGVVSPEMVCSYTVGNQFNFEESIYDEADPTATFQITVNYN